MDNFDLESMVTEIEADAKAIVTLALDVCDNLPAGDNTDKLHAILKLAEDQIRIADETSTMIVTG